ncbi:class I Alpha1,2-mannosidase, partial [Thamnocephalis sphaerospora]
WAERKQAVVKAVKGCWQAYRRDAFGADEYLPLSRSGRFFGDKHRGVGFTIADTLDTLLITGLRAEYEEGRNWVARNLTFNVNATVSVFETTIRVLGGLLSAYALSGDAILLQRARELGDRLLPAFQTPSGLPYPQINLHSGTGQYYTWRGEAVSLAEVGTLQMEFRELSRRTGDKRYWQVAKKVDVLLARMPSLDGLLPTVFEPPKNHLAALGYTMGAEADSYYEYLLKQWLQTSKTTPALRQRYDKSIQGMRKHLVRVSARDRLTFVGNLEDDNTFSARMEHLTCFIAATLALGSMHDTANATRAQADANLAADITNTCVRMYTDMPSGLSPEIIRFRQPASSAEKDVYVRPQEAYNLLRPEAVESLFLMWRMTGHVKYREQGWHIFQRMRQHASTPDGLCFTSLKDVTTVPAPQRDLLESFVMAETFKYLFLLFEDDPNVLPLDRFVFTTEAHPLPIF